MLALTSGVLGTSGHSQQCGELSLMDGPDSKPTGQPSTMQNRTTGRCEMENRKYLDRSAVMCLVKSGLEQADPETLNAYADHAANWLDRELLELLCLGVLMGAQRGTWESLLGVILDRAPDLAVALVKLDEHITSLQKEFIECRADEMIQNMKEDAA